MPSQIFPDSIRIALEPKVGSIRAFEHFDQSLKIRRKAQQRLRDMVEKTGLLRGGNFSQEDMAQLIRLIGAVQKLNPVVLPRLMGTFPYYQEFKGVKSKADFIERMRKRKPNWADDNLGYPGVDPARFSEALRNLLTATEDPEFLKAFEAFRALPGVGKGFLTGVLVLWEPQKYPLINGASIGPFRPHGVLPVKMAPYMKAARKRWGIAEGSSTSSLAKTMAWMLFLSDLREALGMEDFQELDIFLWLFGQEEKPAAKRQGAVPENYQVEFGLEDHILSLLEDAGEDFLKYRADKEAAAREIIEANLGHLSEDQIKEVFANLNRDYDPAKQKATRNRFSPAFTGVFIKQLVANLDETNDWIQRLWKASEDEVPELLEEFWASDFATGKGRSIPTGILYLRDPEKFNVLFTSLDKGYQRLTGSGPVGRTGKAYLAFNRGVAELRETFSVPPQAVDWILWQAGKAELATNPVVSESVRNFRGFPEDAFHFLQELRRNNNASWFDANRERFKQGLLEPTRAMVADLRREVMLPLAPHLESEPKFPKTLATMKKNNFGREEDPYWTHYWAAFHRANTKKTTDFQLYLSQHPDGFQWGFSSISATKEDMARFLDRLRKRGGAAWETAVAQKFMVRETDRAESEAPEFHPGSAEDFAALIEQHGPMRLYKKIPAADPRLRDQGLVDEVAADFRALLPLYFLATADNLEEYADLVASLPGEDEEEEGPDESEAYTLEQLVEETYIDEERVATYLDLLNAKPQLVFYGPPGTGKTWFAERFARYLAGPDGEVETIQFHPTYGYEEFIEGIRPDLNDQGQLRYRVQDGIFKNLCRRALKRPKAKFVLIIDEINRGNLPRIFGELLYLLERREDGATRLAVSQESFTIPRNVLILGTMNTADQSIAILDTALRRRFNFERFDPDPDICRTWLEDNRPGMAWVAELMEELNRTLDKKGIDRERLVGHSFFMHPRLDEERLRQVWLHSVIPLVEEYFYGQALHQRDFELDRLIRVVRVDEPDQEDVSDDDLEDS